MSVTKKHFMDKDGALNNNLPTSEKQYRKPQVIIKRGQYINVFGQTVIEQFRQPSKKIEKEIPIIQQTSNGFKISVKTQKENSFDTQGLQKIQKLIEKFYQYGYLHLDIFVPNTLSENLKQQLITNHQDFNFSINEHNFNEEETSFFERIYQFQGQQDNQISPLLEMCIYQQSIFPNLKQEASKQGFTFKVDFDSLSCQIPVPNNENFQFIDLQKFFVTNIQKNISNLKILKIKTYTNREAIIKFQLLKKLQAQHKFQELQGQLVLIKLNELDQKFQNVGQIAKLRKELKKNTIFLIINSKVEAGALQYNLDQFTSPLSDNLKQNTMNKKIEVKNIDLEQLNITEIEKIAKEYGNVDIICGFDEFQKNINQITINQYYIDKEQVFLTRQQIQEIYEKVINIIQVEIEIPLNQDQLDLWNYYLRFEAEKLQLQFILPGQNETSFSNQNDIRLKFPRQQDRNIKINKLKYLLDSCEIKFLKLNCHKQIFDSLKKVPDVTKLFQKHFQQMTSDTVFAIKIIQCESNQIKFCIIKSNNSSSQDISTQIYHQLQEFITKQLQITKIEFYCFDLDSLNVIIKQYENDICYEYIQKQHLIYLIGMKNDIQKISQELDSLPKPDQINLRGFNPYFIEYLGAGNTQLYSVNEQDQKITIKFYQDNFEKVINEIQKITCSTIQLEIKGKNFNGEQKQQEQIIDIAKQKNIGIEFETIYSFNPENLVEVELQTSSNQRTKKRQIKLIAGNISEVQCQALVIQNYYESIDLFSKQDCLKQLRLLYEQSINNKEFSKFLSNNSQNIELFELNTQGNSQPKKIIYISPNAYNTIAKNNNYYLPNIQKMLIKKILQLFHQNKIQEAVFQVLAAGVVKSDYVAASKLLLREITDQLENQQYDISQIFIAESNKDLIKDLRNQFFNFSSHSNEEQIEYQYFYSQKKNVTKVLNYSLSQFITENLDILKQYENQPLNLPIQYDETPPSHKIDFNSKQICNLSNFQTQNLQMYEILGQNIFFINYQQVDQSLNDYLSYLKDKIENEDQDNFDININQDQVIFSQNQLFLIDSKGTKFNLLKKESDNNQQNEFQYITQSTDFAQKIYSWEQVPFERLNTTTIKIPLKQMMIIHSDQQINFEQIKAELSQIAKNRGLEISICKQ